MIRYWYEYLDIAEIWPGTQNTVPVVWHDIGYLLQALELLGYCNLS